MAADEALRENKTSWEEEGGKREKVKIVKYRER